MRAASSRGGRASLLSMAPERAEKQKAERNKAKHPGTACSSSVRRKRFTTNCHAAGVCPPRFCMLPATWQATQHRDFVLLFIEKYRNAVSFGTCGSPTMGRWTGFGGWHRRAGRLACAAMSETALSAEASQPASQPSCHGFGEAWSQKGLLCVATMRDSVEATPRGSSFKCVSANILTATRCFGCHPGCSSRIRVDCGGTGHILPYTSSTARFRGT